MTAPTNLTRILAIRTALASLLAGWLAVYMYMYIYIHIYVLAGWIAGWLYVYIYIYVLAGWLADWLAVYMYTYIYICVYVLAGWLAGTWLAPNLPRLGHKTFCKACFGHSTVLKKHHQMCVPDVGSDVCKIRATQRPGSHQICPDWVTKPSAKHASAIRLC